MIEPRPSDTHGTGLFAMQDIPAGTNLGDLIGEYVRRNGPHVLHMDDGRMLKVINSLRYINHGDNPNAAYFDDLTVGTLRDVRVNEEIFADYGGEDTLFNGYTQCSFCLRTARVTKGRIGYHIAATWDDHACPNFGVPALWVEKRALIAGGRNPRGGCMACGWAFEDGHNPDCQQCGLSENWMNE